MHIYMINKLYDPSQGFSFAYKYITSFFNWYLKIQKNHCKMHQLTKLKDEYWYSKPIQYFTFQPSSDRLF